MKKIDAHTWQATEPTPILIGRPQTPPGASILSAMKQAVTGCGATEILWFWVSVQGDQPHLGLAVSPPAAIPKVGPLIEAMLKIYSPKDSRVDIFPLSDTVNPSLEKAFRENGESLL